MKRQSEIRSATTIVFLSFGLLASSVLSAVILFATTVEAKSPNALLQDGLYAEEIDGDIDAAMKIYEQIIADESAQSSTVAKAMYRLGMCHLKKQNEQQAKVIFEKLVARFPEQTSMVQKVQPLLDKMSNPDPAALMPADTKIYMELGSPGRQLERILNMLKGTPLENPLAAIGGTQGGEKSPGDIMAALLNPSMLAEFKKVRGIAIGLAVVPVNVSNPRAVAVLYLGQSDALKGLLLAGLGMAGKPGEPIEGMQTVIIGDAAGVAYDDKVMIIGQPLEQLTWSVKQYKGVTAEATLASENRLFARLSRKTRQENAVTIWLDGAATFVAISQQMGGSDAAQLKLVDGVADFNSLQEVVASLSIGEQSIEVEANVGLKDGHRCLAYDLIRTPNLSRAGFEAVPPEAVAVVSLALGELQPGQTERAQEAVRNLTGLDIGREIFANIEQVTLFALPPGAASKDSPLARRFSPIAPCLGLAVTSHNPQKTQQLLNQLLTVAGLIANVSGGGQSGREAEQLAGRYRIGAVDNKPAYCYTEQVGRTTIVALSPEVLQASLSAAKTRQSALAAGPLKESLDQLPAETSKLVVVNVAGAILLADSFIEWKFDNPKNPGHRLLAQYAQACGKTSVRLRTGERINSFNLRYSVEELPPLGSVFPTLMALSQTNLQAKYRATEPRPSEGAVVAPGAEVELSWKAGANAKSHKLYLATQPEDLPLVDEVTEPAYAKLPRPQMDKTYYWRVDEVQGDGSVIEGDVWNFNTGKLVAWWKFDEASGTKVADSSGGGYDGTAVHGKPVWDPNGTHGGCLDFDETYGFSIPKEVFGSINKAVTISVWVKGNEKQREHSDVILQAGAGDDGKPYIVSIYTDWLDYGLKFATGFGEPDRLEFSPGVPEDWTGRWNHYAFVKDADEGFQRIYLNGTLVAEERGTTAPMAGVGAARIGIAPDRFGDQHIGELDDLRIYNYALAEQEIAALCPTPKASGVAPAQLAFGPVIERVIPEDTAGLDFETGKMFTIPKVFKDGPEEAAMKWVVDNGIDAGADKELIAMDVAGERVPSEAWSQISAAELTAIVQDANTVKGQVIMPQSGQYPPTYAFRTREGGVGIVQILDVIDEGTKIQYKMVSKDAPPTETVDPNSIKKWKIGGLAELAKAAKDEIAAKHNKSAVDRMAEMGWDLRKLERFERAEEVFKKALEIDPTNASALRGLAVTYIERKEYDEAIRYYQMWLDAEPDNADAKAGLERAKTAKQQ